MKISDNKKCFLVSMTTTLLILILIIGMSITEKNIKNVGFGEDIKFFEYEKNGSIPRYIKLHFMGNDYEFYI